MEELLREVSKPLLPLEKAEVLVALIAKMMADRLTTDKVGALLIKAGPTRHHFLPEFWEFCHRIEMQREGGQK